MARQAIDNANARANQEPDNIPHKPGFKYIAPLQATVVWRKALLFAGPAVMWGGAVYLAMNVESVSSDLAALVSGFACAGIASKVGDLIVNHASIEFIRTGSIQMITQFEGFLFKMGLEQTAIFVDPTLLGQPSSFPPTNHTIAYPGNSTLAAPNCAVDDPCIWNEQTAWFSLAVIGIPTAVQLINILIPHRRGTSVISALAARVEYDARGEAIGRYTVRRHRVAANLIRYGAPPLIFFIAVGGSVALGRYGQRKLLLRLLSGWNSALVAARLRDFLVQWTDGVVRGGADVFQPPDTGWRRKQVVRIPALVLAELERLCKNDPDRVRYDVAVGRLEDTYWRLFRNSRLVSMISYGTSGAAGLVGLRIYFSPSVHGVFASTVWETLASFAGAWLGTSINEGWEDFSATVAQRFVASMMNVPYEAKLGVRYDENLKRIFAKLKENSATMHVLSFVSMARHLPGQYTRSKVKREPQKPVEVIISIDDKIEIHSGIRSLQNMATSTLFTAGGTLGSQTSVGQTLLSLGVLVNMATHWRGNTVAQVLIPGREAEMTWRHPRPHADLTDLGPEYADESTDISHDKTDLENAVTGPSEKGDIVFDKNFKIKKTRTRSEKTLKMKALRRGKGTFSKTPAPLSTATLSTTTAVPELDLRPDSDSDADPESESLTPPPPPRSHPVDDDSSTGRGGNDGTQTPSSEEIEESSDSEEKPQRLRIKRDLKHYRLPKPVQ